MGISTPASVRVDLRIYPHDDEEEAWVLEGDEVNTHPAHRFRAATTTSVVTSVSGTVPARWTGTHTPPVPAPQPSSGAV